MYDPLILALTNKVAREGITDEAGAMLISLTDSMLNIRDLSVVNVANLQTLLLLLQDFEIKPHIKRLTDELKLRVIRQSLGENWIHGNVTAEYTLTEMNKDLIEKNYSVFVYEDGTVRKVTTYSIQPEGDKDALLLNDMGRLALDD